MGMGCSCCPLTIGARRVAAAGCGGGGPWRLLRLRRVCRLHRRRWWRCRTTRVVARSLARALLLLNLLGPGRRRPQPVFQHGERVATTALACKHLNQTDQLLQHGEELSKLSRALSASVLRSCLLLHTDSCRASGPRPIPMHDVGQPVARLSRQRPTHITSRSSGPSNRRLYAGL